MSGQPPRPPLPEGIQRLLRRAAADPAFADELVATRADAAPGAGVELTASEAAVLASIDGPQLRSQIDALRGAGATDGDVGETIACGGIAPDEPPPRCAQATAPDLPPTRGHGADVPGRLWRWLRRK